jgi:asparagine synthase (glutamine-hydrolysing)
MYAFTLYDRAERAVFLVRDPMGIKPLYVCERNGTVYFASEVKAIRAVLDGLSLNTAAVNAFFLRQYIGGPQTIFEEVNSVEPGTYRRLCWGGATERSTKRTFYQMPITEPRSISLRRASDHLDAELHRAVEEHMLSDVPVGLFLSGGLDSSLLLAFASDVATEPLSTFSVGFGDARVDETHHARLVAESLGARHH